MKYAVIEINNNQFKVSEGEEFLVDKLNGEPNARVMFVSDGEMVEVGTPYLKNAKVELKVLGEAEGKKLHVMTYKAKSRYRRKLGFRPSYTKLQVNYIKL